jgi:hypothetical protein
MKGGPTSASTGSPLARPTFIPGTPRFVWFIALFGGAGPIATASSDDAPTSSKALPSLPPEG